MNKNARKVFSWFVIAMMVMMPLRGVLGLPQAACDMQEPAAHAMADHSMHAMHLAGQSDQAAAAVSHDCCDSAMHCTNDCGIGSTLSFVSPSTISLPSSSEALVRTHADDDLVFREITPPFRPPAHL